MHFTEDDIEKLGEAFKESLRQGNSELPKGAASLSEIQDWMIRHNTEHPEVLKAFIKKSGPGSKSGEKKMS